MHRCRGSMRLMCRLGAADQKLHVLRLEVLAVPVQVEDIIVSRPSRPKQGRGGGVPELRNSVSNLLKMSGYYTYAHPLVLHTTDGTRRGRTSVCSGTAPLTTIPPRPSSPRVTDKSTTCCSSNGNIWLALPCAPPPTLSLPAPRSRVVAKPASTWRNIVSEPSRGGETPRVPGLWRVRD